MKGFLAAWTALVAGTFVVSAIDTSRFFVVLEREPLAALQEPGRRAALSAVSSRKVQLAADQDAVASEVVRRGGRVIDRYVLLNNALFVEVPPSEAAALQALPGVQAVRPERHFLRSTSTSVPFVGAGGAWTLPAGKITGKGMRIGIIDSGIDYTHADFGGPGTVDAYQSNDGATVEAGSFPTAKVVGGWDFVGDDYDSSGINGNSTPSPDGDPLDTVASGHGTHVAGIAAGLGVLRDGSTYQGPYDTSLNPADFRIGPGVAPDASLYALKVFGAGGSTSSSIIVKALNWAADPNGDGDTSDHLDAVNLSLGSPFGDDSSGDVEAAAVDRLARLGVVSAIAAGNNGNAAYNVSSPGIAARGIAVANAYDDGFELTAIRVNSPAAVAGELGMVEGSFTPQLAGLDNLTAQLVATQPADACSALRNTAQLAGKIALIDRGTCFFSDKVRAAQAAGAVAVVMVNNVEGPPIAMAGSGDTSDITIPAVMISRADGLRLRGQLSAGVTVTLGDGVRLRQRELADTLNESSARGPSLGSGSLKPDIAAPGSSILSARSGGGSEGVQYSGTSMSAPHVAGAAALVRQAHPGWSTEDLKASLMNTAIGPMHDTAGAAYPESLVGAGRLNVAAAARTQVIAKVADDSGRVSLSFRPQVLSAPVSLSARVRVVNHGSVPATYQLSSSNTLVQPGARLVPSVGEVTVPAGGDVVVDVHLELDPAGLVADADRSSPATVRGGSPRYGIPEASGQLWLRGGPVDSPELHVPWHVVVRAASAIKLTALEVGVPTTATAILPVPMQGPGVVPHPLVGLFQYGTQASGDGGRFLAVGAAADRTSAGSTANTRLFFGLAWSPGWTTPQRHENNLDIEIDLNNDGVADKTLSNANVGSLGGFGIEDYESANDGLVTAVQSPDGSIPATGEVWNALPPDYRDTATQPAGRAVLAAKASLIGFPGTQTSFRYRGVVEGNASGSRLTTTWQTFDLAKPLVDATPYGLRNTPWFESTNARIRINRAAAAGKTVAEVLVLPLNNVGSGYQRLRMNLTTEDVNANGIPDAWEIARLGDLDSGPAPADDRDGDGFPDLSEYRAGTDPRDPESRLAVLPPVPGSASVRWLSVDGHVYSLWRSDALGTGFHAVGRNLMATPPVNEFVDPEPVVGAAAFYRVQMDE